MEKTTRAHFKAAGRTLKFRPDGDLGIASWVDDRTNNRIYDTVIQLRSLDIPVEIEDSGDVGMVGSDCLEEKKLQFREIDLELLAAFDYGRRFDQQPRLEIVRRAKDNIRNIAGISPGTMIVTEYPELTKRHLEDKGNKKVIALGTNNAPQLPWEFRQYCKENGLIGMRIVHGRVPGLVNLAALGTPEQDRLPYRYRTGKKPKSPLTEGDLEAEDELAFTPEERRILDALNLDGKNGNETDTIGVLVSESGTKIEANGLAVLDPIMNIRTFLVADFDSLRLKRAEINRLHNDLWEAYISIRGESEFPPQFGERTRV